MSTAIKTYLDIYIGNKAEHTSAQAAYDRTVSLLAKNAAIYGLPTLVPEELDEEGKGILQDIDSSVLLSFAPPPPLCAGRLVFALDPSPGLTKTRNNFLALSTGEKGSCKGAPNKKLYYEGIPIHRVVKGFVMQGGDVTRGDGSGGESIYGRTFNDDKAGLKLPIRKGSLAMANSGRANTNSSQFFVVLTDDEQKLNKMKGNYVVFGEVVEGWEVLGRIEAVGSIEGETKVPVWIGQCGAI